MQSPTEHFLRISQQSNGIILENIIIEHSVSPFFKSTVHFIILTRLKKESEKFNFQFYCMLIPIRCLVIVLQCATSDHTGFSFSDTTIGSVANVDLNVMQPCIGR